MSRTDYLVSKLNLNSVQFDSMGSSDGEGPILDMMSVFAALGMGKLSTEAELLGMWIHCNDEVARRQFRDMGAMRVEQMFQENNWSSSKPFQTHIKRWLDNKTITENQIQDTKRELAVRFYRSLTNLAIAELKADGDCMTCEGRGTLKRGARCYTCKGKRKHAWSAQYKADFVGPLSLEAWKKTWRGRYQIIFLEFQPHLIAFEDHLKRYCRGA